MQPTAVYFDTEKSELSFRWGDFTLIIPHFVKGGDVYMAVLTNHEKERLIKNLIENITLGANK